jgi:hypothetical protein
MTVGIQNQIRMLELAKQNQNLMAVAKTHYTRLEVIKRMMMQFQVQCNSLPEDDSVRVVIETFIKAVNDAANGSFEKAASDIVVPK